jgi:hypothetical protein
MKLNKGESYRIIVENQYVGGTFLKEVNTIFGKRYLFDVDIKTRMMNGSVWEHSKVYKIKEKNIID